MKKNYRQIIELRSDLWKNKSAFRTQTLSKIGKQPHIFEAWLGKRN